MSSNKVKEKCDSSDIAQKQHKLTPLLIIMNRFKIERKAVFMERIVSVGGMICWTSYSSTSTNYVYNVCCSILTR